MVINNKKAIGTVVKLIRGSSKTLYILCGLPYSGKTHLAREILEKTDCAYVSIDRILESLGYDWDSSKLPDEAGWKKVFGISYEQAKNFLRNGQNVLYDSTNHTKESREILRRIAREAGANARLIYIDVPVEVVRERWEKNREINERFVLSKKLLDSTIEAMEIPGEDEDVLRLKNN